MKKDVSKFILLSLLIYFPLYRDITVIDGIAYQWLFLSSFNLLSFILILITDKHKIITLINFLKKEIYIYSYLFFLVISSISLINSVNLSVGIVDLTRIYIVFSTIISVYLLIATINNKQSLYSIGSYFFLIFCLLEVTQVIVPILKSISLNQFLGRSLNLKGIGYNINVTAFSLTIKIPFLIYLSFSKQKLLKVFSLFLLFLFLISIIEIQSRASFIALSLILIITISIKSLRSNVLLFPVLLSILFIGFSGLYNNIQIKRITDVNFVLNSDQSSLNRLRYWSDALNVLKENPLSGIGIGSWKTESISFSKEYIREYVVPYHVHNDFLQYGAELGILGGLLYLILFILPLYSLFKIYYVNKNPFVIILLVSLSVILIDSFFNFPRERALIMSYYSIIIGVLLYIKNTVEIKNS